MNTELTFEEAIEQIKKSGEKVKETVEVAEQLAEIINAITDARIEQGLSQRDLARKSGIKQSAIARMESIQAIPRLDTLSKVSRSLDIRIKAENRDAGSEKETTTVYVLPNSIYNNRYAGGSAFRSLVPAVIGA